MGIWTYRDKATSEIVRSYGFQEISHCPFCLSLLSHLLGRLFMGTYLGADLSSHYGDHGKQLQACQICGWWLITQREGYAYGSYEGSHTVRRACGSLKNLDLTDISVPIGELRTYLLARYHDRFWVNPKRYEDLVGGIFSDFGYCVRVTHFSGDDGIDVMVLDGKSGDTIGVQVKRYSNKIEAEQIRAFGGSLVLNGITKGIFITTSTFRSGAIQTVARYKDRDIAIELWDSDEFYSKLRLAQRSAYVQADDQSAPYFALWNGSETIPVLYSNSW